MDKLVTVFDVEAFIDEVKQRPAIWDISYPDYTDKIKKQQAWKDICVVFRKDYDQLDKEAKLAIANDLHRKWKNLRQCFRRELDKRKNDKSRPGRNGKSAYVYYDLLSFLVPVMGSKSHSRAVSNVDEEDDETAIQSEDNRDSIPQLQSQPSYFIPKKRKHDNEQIAELYGVMKQNLSERNTAHNDEDDDKHFLLSLLKPMRCISPHLKFSLRTEIMQVVGRYYNASLPQNSFSNATQTNFPPSYFSTPFSQVHKLALPRHPSFLASQHFSHAANSMPVSSPASSDESVLDFSDM
nr:uncharacterized protein LOC106680663 [Halyomorpha halys]